MARLLRRVGEGRFLCQARRKAGSPRGETRSGGVICHAKPHGRAGGGRQCDFVKSRNGKNRNQESGEKLPRGEDVHEAVVFDAGVFLPGGEGEGVVRYEEIHWGLSLRWRWVVKFPFLRKT